MANRSYLYAIDFDRTVGEREKGQRIFGLSEYPYSIPLSYKILVSQQPKISKSINWDYEYPIAIQGNFKEGKQKLFDYLDQLSELDLFDREEFTRQVSETETFLNAHELENILLECGELYEMGDGQLEDQNADFFENNILKIEKHLNEYLHDFRKMKAEILQLKAEITKLNKPKGFLSGLFSSEKPGNDNKIKVLQDNARKIEQEMWNLLGINDWSDVLYYHFEND